MKKIGIGLSLLVVLQGDLRVLGEKPKDVDLQVGIVQRFGEETKDKLTIKSLDNTPITVKIPSQPNPIQASQVKIGITQKSLKEPILEERIVLSDHGTYETAEDSANQWKAKGIPVEIVQPNRWEVWAKRTVYSTPLVRRWLLNSLQKAGYTQPVLRSQWLKSQPLLSLQIGTKNYNLTQLNISSNSRLIQVSGENKHPKTRAYPGTLYLQPNAYNNYTLVNKVGLEDYLRGVVPHEIGPNAPFNAVKAQVILARTYALRNVRRFQADNYQLCATTHCQVYYGLTETSPQADRAIKETTGLVLTYNNELVDALYSAMTGGVTATFRDIWNGSDRPYLRSLIDSPQPMWNLTERSLADETSFMKFINLKEGFNESGRNIFRWNKARTLENLTKDLQEYLQGRQVNNTKFTKILEMKITKRAPSGRILNMVVRTDKGEIILQKNEVRSAFEPPRSTLFYLEPIYEAKKLTGYRFIGGGFGHGVGFSQYGSYNLAKLGWSHQRILSFYYPNTQLKLFTTPF